MNFQLFHEVSINEPPLYFYLQLNHYVCTYFCSQVAVQGSSVLEEGTEGVETKDSHGIELEDPSASTKVEVKDSQVVGAGGPETPNVEGEEDCGAVSIQLFAIDQKYEMRICGLPTGNIHTFSRMCVCFLLVE